MILTTQDFYDLYNGGESILGTTRFMRNGFEETPDEINDRLNWASYTNYQKKIINTYLSYVFFGNVEVTPSEPLDMIAIARKLAKHALIGGEAYAFEAEEKIHIFSKLECQGHDGIYTISGKPFSTIIDLNQKTVTGLRVGTTTEQVTEPLKEGRFVICQWSGDGASLITDTAMMNIQIFNLQSMLDAHFNRSLWFMMYGPGLGPGKTKPKPRDYIVVSKDEVPPGLTVVDASVTDKIRTEINIRKMEMAISVGLEQEFSDNIKVESGVSRAIKMLDTNAIVSSAAFHIEKAVNAISEYHAKEYKHEQQTLKLNPLLKVTTKDEEYAKYKFLLEYCGTDEVAKAVQVAALKACITGDIEAKDMDLLVKDIEKNGGRKIFESSQYVGHE